METGESAAWEALLQRGGFLFGVFRDLEGCFHNKNLRDDGYKHKNILIQDGEVWWCKALQFMATKGIRFIVTAGFTQGIVGEQTNDDNQWWLERDWVEGGKNCLSTACWSSFGQHYWWRKAFKVQSSGHDLRTNILQSLDNNFFHNRKFNMF